MTICPQLTKIKSIFSPAHRSLNFMSPPTWASTKIRKVPSHEITPRVDTVRHISCQTMLSTHLAYALSFVQFPFPYFWSWRNKKALFSLILRHLQFLKWEHSSYSLVFLYKGSAYLDLFLFDKVAVLMTNINTSYGVYHSLRTFWTSVLNWLYPLFISQFFININFPLIFSVPVSLKTELHKNVMFLLLYNCK